MSEIKIDIKYFDTPESQQPRLQAIAKGDWIDLYAAKDIFVPLALGKEGVKPTLVPLGIAMKLPEDYEAYILPRSSTFKTWGIIQTNHMGVVDHTYCGDNDQWMMPVICVSPRTNNGPNETPGTYIRKGDKICQFRIQKRMPELSFNEVTQLGSTDRGGFGSTGTN